MALPSSGQISLNQIHVEAGGSSGSQVKVSDTDVKAIINANNNNTAFSDYYGASAETSLPTGGSQINGQVQLKQITVSDYISSGETLRIPSSMWVWSDDTSVAALIIDIACTVVNDGKIIGKGGAGGNGFYNSPPRTGSAGGPAINVTASGVTITNSSGAYIAGGGGGGGSYSDYSNAGDAHSGGGGGAGGGAGGTGRLNSGFQQSGPGGILNASGGDGGNGSGGDGGGAGGGGGGLNGGAGGGGRILPGVGGGNGGSAGNAAVSPGSEVWRPAGGGGGWGAAGALGGGRFAGGAGGAAITGTSRTLSNSGTIYGAT